MKHLNKLFAGALLFAGLTTQAQDSNNPWAVSFGVNGVDTKVSAVGNDSPKWIQLANANKNWNILPSVSYLNVSRYVGDGFSFGLTGSVNKIDKWVSRVPGTSATDLVSDPGNLSYYGIDATVKYSFMELLKSKWLDPSAHIGGGYTFFGDASAGTVNGGLGLTFWVTENVGLQFQSTYKHSFDDNRVADSDVPTHIQHFAGVSFKFGGKDTDGDGIYDKDDACPEVAGLPEFKGCPDTDKDGIQDSADACPEVAGLAEFNGCPDTDGDGIIDSEDDCVDVKGTKIMKGCPDTDGDGVADKNDNCPTVAGAKDNAGCPWPDTDADGVADKDDKCPTVKGTIANNGCPEVSDEAMKKLNDYGKTILFNSGKASFQKQTIPVLQAMAAILKEYPTANFSLEGHTDSDGKEAMNQKLSEERAAAVKNFLVENGIEASRLSSKGFGESMPVDSNKTAKGKANNRRVEVKLVK
jgi:outer membrane protein OmpA-like peptidoglycan-associated protein